MIDNPMLAKIGRRKLITQKMVLALIDVAKEKGGDDRVKAYWKAYHCQSKLVSKNGKIYTSYCKNRYCLICCAIRKAEMINKYYPTLLAWEDAHFVTLTVKACKASELNLYMSKMLKGFKLIVERCKKRHTRGKGIHLVGIKSLECNFNPKNKTYNPHFHIIVKNKAMANLLKKEWLAQWRPKDGSYRYKYTTPIAQSISKLNNLETGLIEVIKYGSKIFTEPDLKTKNKNVLPKIYANALDNIFVAMKGKRLFERFGFNTPKQNKEEPTTMKLISDFDTWSYDTQTADWVNEKSGECLTSYSTPAELHYLLNNGVDLVKQ